MGFYLSYVIHLDVKGSGFCGEDETVVLVVSCYEATFSSVLVEIDVLQGCFCGWYEKYILVDDINPSL